MGNIPKNVTMPLANFWNTYLIEEIFATCCLTLDKSLNLFVPQFPICKMGIIMLTALEEHFEHH